MNAIEIKNLHFSYGKENVLDGVSLCLKEGRLAILAGENGAGKSTLLRLLLGELPIGENPKGDQEEGSSDGSIEILGQDIRQFKDWSSISYVPQNGMGGWKDFPASVKEIVLSGCQNRCGLRPFYNRKEKQIAAEMMEKLQISDLSRRCYRELSGGQQQRVLLARALCAAQKILFLDEPVSGLDPKATEEMYDLIQKLNHDDGITIIMISHDMRAAENYASHILYIGDPVFCGTRDEYMKSEIYGKLNNTNLNGISGGRDD